MIYRIDKNNDPVPVSKTRGSTAVIGALPVGFMTMFAGNDIPEGYMAAWGQSLERAEYPELFDIIGTRFGAEDDEHFNLPDTREVVIVGAGTNSKLTNDVYTEGQFKEHQFASHTHEQAPHSHTDTEHTHSMSHTHTAAPHSHGNYKYNASLPQVFTNNLYHKTGGSSITCCTSSVDADSTDADAYLTATIADVCSATATNNATGAESGGTHGKRMGIYYIIKVEAR